MGKSKKDELINIIVLKKVHGPVVSFLVLTPMSLASKRRKRCRFFAKLLQKRQKRRFGEKKSFLRKNGLLPRKIDSTSNLMLPFWRATAKQQCFPSSFISRNPLFKNDQIAALTINLFTWKRFLIITWTESRETTILTHHILPYIASNRRIHNEIFTKVDHHD